MTFPNLMGTTLKKYYQVNFMFTKSRTHFVASVFLGVNLTQALLVV